MIKIKLLTETSLLIVSAFCCHIALLTLHVKTNDVYEYSHDGMGEIDVQSSWDGDKGEVPTHSI